MDKEKITKHLLKSLKVNYQAVKELEDVLGTSDISSGVCCYTPISDTIFYLWEILEDNTFELFAKYPTQEDALADPNLFCRDYWSDALFEFCNDEKSLDDTVNCFASNYR